MRKIKYWYGTRNDRYYGEMEVADDITDKEIKDKIKSEMYDYIDYGFEEVED